MTNPVLPTLASRWDYPRGALSYYRYGKEVFVFIARFNNHKTPTLIDVYEHCVKYNTY